jgi:hypothetical protein
MSAQTATTCEAINDNFVRESGRVALGTYRLGLYKDPYLRFVSQSAFPDNMGKTITNIIAQRTIATGTGWEDIGVTGESGQDNACLAPVKTVGYAFDTKTFTLRQQAVESNFICLEDVRTSAFPIDDVNNYIKILADNVNVEWIKRYDDDYLTHSTKLSVEPGIDNSGTVTFDGATGLATIAGTPAPTSVLTPGVLRQIHDNLYQENAGDDGDAVTDDGAPVFNVFAERATIENLIKLQQDVREDIRFAEQGMGEAARLMQSWSVDRAFGGFMHIIDVRMPRYDFVGGEYVERPFYADAETAIGDEAVVNPAYINAGYEAAFVWHPDVIHREVPAPLGSVGSDTRGTAWNFNGEVQWLNIPDKTLNPFSDIGFWAARLNAAYRPIKPRYGYVLIYKRCPNIPSTDCPSYT